ncbi:MAG: hypothetical protein LC803_07545 [Acidobacteria bacterium]|nr:hypothetical protein [Acidobacteriota bacterium]
MLEQLRRAELEVLKGWLRPDMRIPKIGGGSGFQAGVVASRGDELMSIDPPERPFPLSYLFPVADYDGVNIPAPDASFDLISSAMNSSITATRCSRISPSSGGGNCRACSVPPVSFR